MLRFPAQTDLTNQAGYWPAIQLPERSTAVWRMDWPILWFSAAETLSPSMGLTERLVSEGILNGDSLYTSVGASSPLFGTTKSVIPHCHVSPGD